MPKVLTPKVLAAKVDISCLRARLLCAAVLLPAIAVTAAAQTVTQPFTFSIVGHDLPAIRSGGVAWGDMDGDGDLDAALAGLSEGEAVTAVYRNDGRTSTGFVFTHVALPGDPVTYARVSWGDADGDGDLDLLVMGSSRVSAPYAPVSVLYRNTGGAFEPIADAGLPAIHSGSVDWGDLDGDGDLDLLLTGEDGSGDPKTVRALNDGTGRFQLLEDGLVGIAYGDAALADANGDGRLDILLSGVSDAGFVSRLYMAGDNGFSVAPVNLPSLAFSSVEWGDVDGDGDLDFVVSGAELSTDIFTGTSVLYTNSGGTFTADASAFQGILAGDVTFGDYDNDGDLDALVFGAETVLGRRTARIYRNDAGTFVMTSLLVGAFFADADWGDVDGDGDLDLVATGLTSSGVSISNVYVNERQVIPPIPNAPAGLTVSTGTDASVQLGWSADATASLTFNVRVGTSPGAGDVMSAMAHPETGRRLLARPGNVSALTSWTLRNLPEGTYYWSVQAVNTAFVASDFAPEGVFNVNASIATDVEDDRPEVPHAFGVTSVYPNPFAGGTTFNLDMPRVGDVTLRVWSVLGTRVAQQHLGVLAAGTHPVAWRPDGLAAGLYFYEVSDGRDVSTGSFTIISR